MLNDENKKIENFFLAGRDGSLRAVKIVHPKQTEATFQFKKTFLIVNNECDNNAEMFK